MIYNYIMIIDYYYYYDISTFSPQSAEKHSQAWHCTLGETIIALWNSFYILAVYFTPGPRIGLPFGVSSKLSYLSNSFPISNHYYLCLFGPVAVSQCSSITFWRRCWWTPCWMIQINAVVVAWQCWWTQPTQARQKFTNHQPVEIVEHDPY